MIRDRMPMRTDPMGLARIRHALSLTREEMAKLLGLDEDGADAGAEKVRQIENGEREISLTLSRLLTTLEIALPGDTLMHPRFMVGEDLPNLEQFIVHTRFPRFFGRLVPAGTPTDGMTCVPVDDIEQVAIYRWQDDPAVLSPAAYRKVLSDTRDFAISYRNAYESMSLPNQADEG